ncbi:hypothetical protein KM043_002801 [Ampulex compressa]|nr:hypothetical protein KM043_002801 [Ampulex compressa]
MKILGVNFAPLNVPMERRLQTLAAGLWILICGLGSFISYLLVAYIIFYTETLRYFLLLYFLWMYYDWDTCNRGGRSAKWIWWLRNNAWVRYLTAYFPVKLVKTVDLDPSKSYLFCSFPHGILSTGVYCAFGSDVLNCRELFKGLDIRVIILDTLFRIPLFREYCLLGGACSSSLESVNYVASAKPQSPYTGRASVLVVGGASESFECQPGTYRILLKKRKGFVRIALKHGTSLVPVFSFGETDLYNQFYGAPGSRLRNVQNYIRKFIGLAPIIPIGRGFFQYSFGLIPRREKITVVVGAPVDVPKVEEPTTELIDEYHEKFTKALIELFETEKHKYVENPETVHLQML